MTQDHKQELASKQEPSSHQVADYPAGYLASFKIDGEAPRGFRDFDCFLISHGSLEQELRHDELQLLRPDPDGNIAVSGKLIRKNGKIYMFETATLRETCPVTRIFRGPLLIRTARTIPIKLTFRTVVVDDVNYAFEGEYLDQPERSPTTNNYIHLRGNLIKFIAGKKTVDSILSLYPDVTE